MVNVSPLLMHHCAESFNLFTLLKTRLNIYCLSIPCVSPHVIIMNQHNHLFIALVHQLRENVKEELIEGSSIVISLTKISSYAGAHF